MAVSIDGGATSDAPAWDSLKPAAAAPGPASETTSPDWETLKPASEPPKESSGIFRRAVADPLVTAAKSVVGTGQAAVGLADIPTLGKAGKALESVGVDFPRTQQILEEAYSPEQQEANRRVRDAQGFSDTLGQYVENPSVIAHDIGQSVGPMLLGQGIGGAAMKAVPAISRGAAGALGEGAVTAGSSEEQIREQTPGGETSLGQTALAAGSGALTGAITGGSNVLAKKLGVGDVNTLFIPGAEDVAKQGLANKAKAVGTEAALEAGQETVQSGQEQAATNLATGKEATEGLGNAMAAGAVTGGGMGLGGGILSQAGRTPVTPPPAPVVASEPVQEEQPKTNFEAVTENLKDQVGPVKGIATKVASMAVDAGITPEQQAAQIADTQPVNPVDGLPEEPSGEVGGPPENTDLNQEPTEQSVTPALDPAAVSMARNALNTVQASLDKGGVMGTVPPVLRNAAKAVGVYDPTMAPDQLLESVAQRLAENDTAPAEQPLENDFDFDESIPFDFPERMPRPTAADQAIARDAAEHDSYHAEDEQDEDAYLEREREIRRQEAAAQPSITQPSTPQQEPENGESENATPEATKTEETVAGKEKYIPTNSIVEAAAVTEAAKRGLTDEQIKAGEYQRGFTKFDGLDIAIENGAGTTRAGVSEDGKRWSQQMKSHYGEIGVRDENGNLKTGADGDLVDVFVNPAAPEVVKSYFVVDQINPKTGAFDEHKVLAGYPTIAAARKAYLENYEPGWKGLGAITPMKADAFKAWLQTEDATKPVSDKVGAPAAPKRTKAPDMQTQIRDAAAKEQDAKIHNELMAGFKEERDFENRAKQRVAFLDKYRNYAAFTQSLINNDFEKAVDDLYRNRVPRDTATQIFEDAKATGLVTDLTQRKVGQELNGNKKPSSEAGTNVEEGRVAEDISIPSGWINPSESDDSRWFGSVIEKKPEFKKELPVQGKVHRVYKGSSTGIIEFQPDGTDSIFRLRPDQIGRVISIVDSEQVAEQVAEQVPQKLRGIDSTSTGEVPGKVTGEVKPPVGKYSGNAENGGIEEQYRLARRASQLAPLFGLNDAVGAYTRDEINDISPENIDAVFEYLRKKYNEIKGNVKPEADKGKAPTRRAQIEATQGADQKQLDNAPKEDSYAKQGETFEERIERTKREIKDNLARLEARVAEDNAPEKQDQSIDLNLEAAKTLLLRAVPDGDLMKLYGDRNIDLRVALFRALSGDQKIPKTKAKSVTDLVNLFYDKAGIPMDTLAGRNAKFKSWTKGRFTPSTYVEENLNPYVAEQRATRDKGFAEANDEHIDFEEKARNVKDLLNDDKPVDAYFLALKTKIPLIFKRDHNDDVQMNVGGPLTVAFRRQDGRRAIQEHKNLEAAFRKQHGIAERKSAAKIAYEKENGPQFSRPDEMTSIFEKLLPESSTSEKMQARQAMAAHPEAARMQYVEDHFYDLLLELEQNGKVDIQC